MRPRLGPAEAFFFSGRRLTCYFRPVDKLPRERVYYLPVTSDCLPGCPHCDRLGCREQADRDLASVERALQRAVGAECKAILFSSGLLLHPLREEFIARCHELGLGTAIQVAYSALECLSPSKKTELAAMTKKGVHLELVATGAEKAFDWEFLKTLSENLSFTVLGLRGAPILGWIEKLHAEFAQGGGMPPPLHFAFPPFSLRDPLAMPAREVFRLQSQIQARFPDLVIRPLRGREAWDSRIARDLCLEPLPNVSLQSKIDGPSPRVSVIIPSYQTGALVKNVLGHLLRQTLPRKEFEIIVIDDGSSDGTFQLVQNFMAPEAASINFTLLTFPRARPRIKGEADFRAGIARNLGVKQARGELLCFLDSDTLVPPDFLETVIDALRESDVVQFVRHHAKNRIVGESVRYEQIEPGRDTRVLEPHYWGKFFRVKDWQSLPFYWKYTCTYALALPKDLFKSVGWIRKVFVFYGFEDTDLGYRLAKAGARFRLHPLRTYHVSSERERLQGGLSPFLRDKFLAKTAKIFYLNTLDPEIYQQFYSFMGEEWSIRRWAASLAKKVFGARSGAKSPPLIVQQD